MFGGAVMLRSGVLNVVLQLVEAGLRVDEKNAAGATALHRAANNGHVSTENLSHAPQ